MLVGIRSTLTCLVSAVLVTACATTDSSQTDQNGEGHGTGSGCPSGCGDGSGSGSGSGSGAEEDDYAVTILQTDKTDPDLVNPWGIVGAEGVFWIADNATGKISVYDGDGKLSAEYPTGHFTLGEGITGIAAMEGDEEEEGGGDEFLMNTGEDCSELTPAEFIVASEEGKLIGINDDAPPTGVVVVDNSKSGAVYLGVAKLDMASGPVLLAANFPAGKLDVFDDEFKQVTVKGFVDDEMPAGWGPFNVTVLDNLVYVAEAKIGPDGDEEAGPGLGAVAIFDATGARVARIKSDLFNAPWGVAKKQEDDKAILMVGNFGDGRITEIDVATYEVEEQLSENGAPISYPGLWGITMGSDAAGDEDALYFVAGTDDETAGVFGRIDDAP